MSNYFEVNGGNGGGRLVAALGRTELTRLFRGTYRIYAGRDTLKRCDAVRFFISPDGAPIRVRFDTSDDRVLEVPLTVGGKEGRALWLTGEFTPLVEIYVFVLPPGHLAGQPSSTCARIWLAFYKPGSGATRPIDYTFSPKVPASVSAVEACGEISLPSLDDKGVRKAIERRLQEDEAEGYHED